jgi:DNA-binding TFAR19-related protein (PDSD5 family)
VPDESTSYDRLYAQPCREPCCAAAAGRKRREIDEAREQTLATVRKRYAIERVEEVGVRLVSLADSVAEDLRRLSMRGRIAARLGQRKLDVAHKCNVGF